MKEITVICRNARNGRETEYTGTIDYLAHKVFGYTLECGKSWEYEKGNYKINTEPKTAKSLITNLNNAEMNTSRYGYQSCYYELKGM